MINFLNGEKQLIIRSNFNPRVLVVIEAEIKLVQLYFIKTNTPRNFNIKKIHHKTHDSFLSAQQN